ncbi:hypothetical protein BDF19DRAFT_419398 [Syncephalis fuscata]|nr:hypothetical protein BDF19DRAFT_419398 [Syncephalis fuscata]
MNPSHLELDRIRHEYGHKLRMLSANVKDQISELTQLAQENIFAAPIIVKLIEDRIHEAPPNQKLPAFYVLDSICKIVRRDYLSLFERNIARTFLETYRAVDPDTKHRMERMLATWRTNVTGSVFSNNTINNIETYLPRRGPGAVHMHGNSHMHQMPRQHPYQRPVNYGGSNGYPQTKGSRQASLHDLTMDYLSTDDYGTSMPPATAPRPDPPIQLPQNLTALLGGITPEHIQLMQEIQGTLTMKQQQLAQQPSNTMLPNVINVLKQLLGMVPTLQLNPTVVAGIRQTLAMQRSPTIAATIGTMATSIPSITGTTNGLAGLAALVSKIAPTPVAIPTPAPAPVPVPASIPATNGVATSKLDPAMIASLIGQLSSVPGLSKTAVKPNATPSLTQEGIQRSCSGLFETLYSGLALRCRQCGLRFRDDERGQERMSAHLDRHFKQNRRLKERTRKVISRSWFVRDQDWIHSRLVANEDENVFAKGTTKEVQVDPEAVLRARTVISPPEGEKAPCPICQEKFEEFWCDEEEEWMLRNAVTANGKIYHATCHTDTSMVEETTSSNSSSGANSPAASNVLGKRKLDRRSEDPMATSTPATAGSTAFQNDAKKMAVTIQMVR